MTELDHEVLGANATDVKDFGDKAKLADAAGAALRHPDLHGRAAEPAKFAGLAEGDAMSTATPADAPATTRSARWSSRQAARHQGMVVIHHTDCGMETFADEVMRGCSAEPRDRRSAGGWKDIRKGRARRKATSSTG